MTRVLVCGGRDYGVTDETLRRASTDSVRLAALKAERLRCVGKVHEVLAPLAPDVVIHGGATGADSLAGRWALDNAVEQSVFSVSKADWDKHGKAAGPLRNARMLAEGKPNLVVAFPGGRGTEDMKRRARAAGVEVREVLL